MGPLKFSADRFFPAKDYLESCKQNRALSITYLIARDHKNIDSLVKEISTLDTRGADWRRPANPWNLTPLHVAVWRQNVHVIQLLLEKKCDPAHKDSMGFTALHYAEAIGNDDIINLVRTATKVDDISYANIWNYALEKPIVKQDKRIFSFEDENGRIAAGNSGKFKELTNGAEFSPTIFFKNRKALLEIIEEELYNTYHKKVQVAYDEKMLPQLINQEPPLHVKKQGDAGYGVVASKPLEAFKPVVIYAGEGVSASDQERSSTSCSYFLPPFEAHKVRSLGGMINDGFPNCIVDTIHHPSGIAYPVIVPIRNIAEGEELFIDYFSIHSVKMMRRIEFNEHEARAFLAEKSLYEWAKDELGPLINKMKVEKKALTETEKKKFAAISSKLCYLINTTALLVPLLLENKISSSDLRALASDPNFISLFNGNIEEQGFKLKLADAIDTIESAQKKFDWDIKGELLTILKEMSLNYNAETVDAALTFFNFHLKRSLSIPIPMPQGMLRKMYLPAFINGAPYFELTRTCFYERRDATDIELAFLDTISQSDPIIETIYIAMYVNTVTDDFPKLKKLILEKKNANLQQNRPQQSIQNFSRMMRNMAPMKIPHQLESILKSMETDPESLNALIEALQKGL